LNSFISSLLPVILLIVTTILPFVIKTQGALQNIIVFFSDPVIVMLLSLLIITFTLGVSRGATMKNIMNSYSDAVRDIALILLIVAGAGALKQVFIDSGVSNEIGNLLQGLSINPLVLGWLMQHYVKGLCAKIVAQPNLSFYFWSISLSITTGITVKNIVHSSASLVLLLMIAVATFLLCFVQFGIGRAIGRRLGEEVNAGQALFQKNTALSIWVAYMYLNPVSSIGAGCYVLWQNIINSLEIYTATSRCRQKR
jgi:hypothetical protein